MCKQMKTKIEFEKILILRREQICKLQDAQMSKVNGGVAAIGASPQMSCMQTSCSGVNNVYH
jgi:hypothetical protein